MKKILLFIALSVAVFAQDFSNIQQDYYGAGNSRSDSLQIAVNDSVTGEYYVQDQLLAISVDSNWTASNITPLIYNNYESTWDTLAVDGGTNVEWEVQIGRMLLVSEDNAFPIKHVKFAKTTGNSTVTQSGSASTIILITGRR